MSKVTVDPEKCIGCGACVESAPSGVFEMGDDGKSHVSDETNIEGGNAGKDVCPTGAIEVKE